MEIFNKNILSEPDIVVLTCYPNTWDNKAQGAQVWGHPGLHTETFSQKKKRKKNLPGGSILIKKWFYAMPIRWDIQKIKSIDYKLM